MPGFDIAEEVVRLQFTHPGLAEAEVRCAVISIGELTEAAKLAQVDQDNPTPEDLAKVDELIAAFAASLRSWNLTRRGRKIPATLRGVKSLGMIAVPPGLGALNLVEAWMRAVSDHHTRQLTPDQVERSLASNPL